MANQILMRPFTESWKERAENLSRRLGTKFDFTNRWSILSAERFANTLRR